MSTEDRTPSTFQPRAILKNKDYYEIHKSLLYRESAFYFFPAEV